MYSIERSQYQCRVIYACTRKKLVVKLIMFIITGTNVIAIIKFKEIEIF